MKVLTMSKYHLLSMWNWRHLYLGRLIEPVAYFVFLSVGVASFTRGGSGPDFQDYLSFALAGVVCLVAFRAATASLGDVSNDRKWGVYALYRMRGGGPVGYLISVGLIAGLLFIAQTVTLFVLYLIVGGTGTELSRMLLILAIGFVIVLGWTGFGAAIGARTESYSTRDLITTLLSLPIVLSAPLFYTLDAAPAYLRAIAAVNPLTYQVSWLRLDEAGALVSFAYSLGWAVAGLASGAIAVSRSSWLSAER